MRLLRCLQTVFRLGRVDAELAEEMEFHHAMKKRELERSGLSEKDVTCAVARAMGNMTGAREEARGVWLPGWAESLFQDSVYAVRNLRRQPGFAVVAIGTLAAAIGLNTSVFTVFAGAALRPWAVTRSYGFWWSEERGWISGTPSIRARPWAGRNTGVGRRSRSTFARRVEKPGRR